MSLCACDHHTLTRTERGYVCADCDDQGGAPPDLRALAEADHQPDLRAAHYVLADASGRYQTLPGGRRATPPKADHA